MAAFHAFAYPDFLLGQQLVEARLLQPLRFQPLRLAFLPLREIARKTEQAPAVQFNDTGGNVVQEAAVVGNDDRAALSIDQHPFQPCDAVEIQVVGRLVQQEQVGFADQRPGQRDPFARPAG